MKLSKEDLKKKIDEKIVDDDLKIELLEDIEDSVDVVSETADNSAEIEELKAKYEELPEINKKK